MSKKSFQLQLRKPGRAYKTTETGASAAELSWAFRQHMGPDSTHSIRIIDAHGAVVVRATPKV